MNADREYAKLMLSPANALPGSTKLRWSVLVDLGNFVTDKHEFCYVVLEKMAPIMCDASALLADSLEIKCTSVPQFQTYDTRTQASTMSLGFASYSSTFTAGGMSWAVLELVPGVTGGVRMPFDVLRNKIWSIEVDCVTDRFKGLLSPDAVINDYVLQVGVYI